MIKKQTVLITGGITRIGLSTAHDLHENGFNIIATYNKSKIEATKLFNDLNNKRKKSCSILKIDLSKQNNFTLFSKKVLNIYGRLDVLINNASKFYPTKIEKINKNNWLDIIDTNLKAPLFLSQVFFSELKKRKGSIVNLIDIHIDPPLKNYIIYNISKAGLLALTKSLAKDFAPYVRVNGVSPGAILWAKHDNNKQKRKEILSRVPLQKSGEPNDIAKAIKFLILEGKYITGQNIIVDGGRKLNM